MKIPRDERIRIIIRLFLSYIKKPSLDVEKLEDKPIEIGTEEEAVDFFKETVGLYRHMYTAVRDTLKCPPSCSNCNDETLLCTFELTRRRPLRGILFVVNTYFSTCFLSDVTSLPEYELRISKRFKISKLKSRSYYVKCLNEKDFLLSFCFHDGVVVNVCVDKKGSWVLRNDVYVVHYKGLKKDTVDIDYSFLKKLVKKVKEGTISIN